MNDSILDACMAEYRQLSEYANRSALSALTVPPAALSLIAGAAAYKSAPSLVFSLAIPLLVFLLLVWVGFIHSLLNGIGLRLIWLECRINERLRLENASSPDALTFYSWFIGKGGRALPLFDAYSCLLVIPFLAIIGYSEYFLWHQECISRLHWFVRGCIMLCPIVPNAIVVAVMRMAELETRRRREELGSKVPSPGV